MYTHLLSTASDDWTGELSGDALVAYALTCRDEVLSSQGSVGRGGGSAYRTLAAEVVYDRALLKLCAAHGIPASPQGFSHPSDERIRLEHALAGVGLDLTGPARDTGAD